MLIVTALLAVLAVPADVAQHRGNVVVLNYWASWCEPCRKELPALERVHRQYRDQGLVTIGVSIDEPAERDAARRLVKELGLSFPIRLDGTTDEMFELGLATSIPATAIFDRDGSRVFRIIGEASEVDVVARVAWLLGDRTGSKPADLALPPSVTPEHFARHESGEEEDEEHHTDGGHEEEGGSTVPT